MAPPDAESRRYAVPKRLGLALLCAIWVVLGLVGHDPWKTEDAAAFGVASEMMRSGDWLRPELAGEPLVDRPPLAYALAAFTGSLFGGVLSAPDASRLAAGVALALCLFMIAATAQELYGRSLRSVAALVLIGSVGLWDRAHQMSPELALLAGMSVGLYGLALIARRPIVGGVTLGIGVGIAFLARGFLGPLWLALTVVILPIGFREWRNRDYAKAIAIASLVAVLLGGSWLLALARNAPSYLSAWWAAQSWSDYFALLSPDASPDPLYVIKNLPWYAWPALPLALWTFWTRGRGFGGGLRAPGIIVPTVLAAVILAVLLVMSEPRASVWMPLLLPLCLLATAEVDTLPRGFSGALDWFGILTFGLLAALVWGVWFDAYLHGISPTVAHIFRDTEPGYRPRWSWFALAISLFLSVVWIALVRPARRTNRRAVLNWAVGMTLVWGLYMTIWLPYLDSRRSYRSVAEALARELPSQGCVASRNLGEPQRALLHHFAGLVTVREEKRPNHACEYLLVQYGRQDGTPIVRLGYEIAWTGSRRGDDTERFVLFRRVAS